MQPWRHAKMTTKKCGADWRDDLAIHEFVDLAKTACPDLRHRLILHNGDLGPALAQLAFPDRSDCREVVLEHVKQDLGTVPLLVDWASTATRHMPSTWRMPDDEMVIEDACNSVGLEDDQPIRDVHSLLVKAVDYVAGDEALGRSLLMNSFGPLLVRTILGPARPLLGRGGRTVVLDPSWVAEGIIVANFGRIDTLSKILAPYTGHLK